MASALTNFIGRTDFQAFTAGSAAAMAGYALGTWTGAGAVGFAALGGLKWYQGYREAQELARAFRTFQNSRIITLQTLSPEDDAELTRLSSLLNTKLTTPYSYTLFQDAIKIRNEILAFLPSRMAGSFRNLKERIDQAKTWRPENDIELRTLSNMLNCKLTTPDSHTRFQDAIASRKAIFVLQPFKLQALASDVATRTCSFLGLRDLESVYRVCESLQRPVNDDCRNRCREKGIVPAILPAIVNYNNFPFKLFADAVGPTFTKQTENHLIRIVGNPSAFPPIPASIVQRADPNFRLVPLPTTIELAVTAGSRLILDVTNAVGRKKARLKEGDVGIEKPRTLQVPVTPNNILILWNLLNPDQFEGGFVFLSDVLDVHGDFGIDEPYWSYQRKGGICGWLGYLQQVDRAGSEGLRVLSLLERMWWHFLSNLQSGNIPKIFRGERLSTVTQGSQTAIDFCKVQGESGYRMSLFNSKDDSYCGAAVGVPP